MLEEFVLDSLRLIAAGVIGFIAVLLSPILITFFCIGNAVESYRKNKTIDRLNCENCSALMRRVSLELAKVENTKNQNEWSLKVAKAEQQRKSYINDPNATYEQKVYASSKVNYRSPYTKIDAICLNCKTKYIYSDRNSRFRVLVENQES
jgi:hypothetical protein